MPNENFALTYGGPFIINYPEEIKLKVQKNFIGNIIYLTIKNNTYINELYLFSIPIKVKILNGKLFNDNGELNNNEKKTKKYMLNSEFFDNYSDITIEFNENINPEIYYEKKNAEVLENRKYNNYLIYKLNFKKSNEIYYLGFYENTIDTYAFADNLDNSFAISYKDDNSNLYPVLPNENFHKLNSFFFPLKTQYNFIKFSWNGKNKKYNKEFIIFNPDITKEDFEYSKQGKFYIRQDLKKTITLKINKGEEKDIYRVITKSLNNKVKLNINQKNEYNLNETNRYTNIWEIKKGEKFYYEASSYYHSLLFSKVLEGSIYKQLTLFNSSVVNNEKANNIIFNLALLKNTTSYTINITNAKRTKFYYTIYHIKENEIELRRLILPILNYEKKESEYSNLDISTINIFNPYYINDLKELDCYFALSYEQDFENPVENNDYKNQLIYNERIENKYKIIEKSNPFFFNIKNYNTKYTLDKDETSSNLVLTFIIYQLNSFISNLTYENSDFKSTILYNKYTQIFLNNINTIGEHQIEIKLKENSVPTEYSCVWFHYFYTNDKINIDDFQKYNNKDILQISQDNRKISWNEIDKVAYYELYITNDNSKKDLFENECYLTNLKNNNSSDVQIIYSTNNFYEFEDKTQSILINVVAYETKYKMRIVYYSLDYQYQKSYTFMIVLISIGVVIVLVIIIICCKKKKSIGFSFEYLRIN